MRRTAAPTAARQPRVAERVLSLPMSADLTQADQDRVVAALAGARGPVTPLLRATLTLMAGGALAQALPLLLGPLLTRLYTPSQFGLYHLFAAVAANLAVVACARYEHALPLANDEAEAQALHALCRWILLGAVGVSSLAAVGWALAIDAVWPLWLPAAVGALGLVSLATLWAMRAQRFRRWPPVVCCSMAAARRFRRWPVRWRGAVGPDRGPLRPRWRLRPGCGPA